MKKLLGIFLTFLTGFAWSASPTVTSVTSGQDDVNDTTKTLTYPATILDSDGLLACIATDNNGITITWPAPWVEDVQSGAPVATIEASCAHMNPDGTEDGTTFDITLGASERATWWIAVIDGWDGSTAPEYTQNQDFANLTADPASITPSGGSDDYLYAASGMFDGQPGVTGFSSGYANTGHVDPAISGSATISWSFKETTASTTEDPGVITLDTSSTYVTYTIAVAPTASGGLTTDATKCVFASGDEISVTANASTTSGDCATAKSMFLSGGDLSNTRIGVLTNAYLANATETTTADNLTINSPDDGVTDHFGTAACANPGCDDDSLYENSDFLTEYAAFASGDDVWVTVNTGACDFEATTGVFSCTSVPATGVVRVYDVTATDWLTESSWTIEAPSSGLYLTPLNSPIRSPIRSPLRAPIQ